MGNLIDERMEGSGRCPENVTVFTLISLSCLVAPA
jgi:hypothetical protein